MSAEYSIRPRTNEFEEMRFRVTFSCPKLRQFRAYGFCTAAEARKYAIMIMDREREKEDDI